MKEVLFRFPYTATNFYSSQFPTANFLPAKNNYPRNRYTTYLEISVFLYIKLAPFAGRSGWLLFLNKLYVPFRQVRFSHEN